MFLLYLLCICIYGRWYLGKIWMLKRMNYFENAKLTTNIPRSCFQLYIFAFHIFFIYVLDDMARSSFMYRKRYFDIKLIWMPRTTFFHIQELITGIMWARGISLNFQHIYLELLKDKNRKRTTQWNIICFFIY